ncbi:thermonuclease family protein [Dyadobacter sp. CY107]|uniref:thermonuclease family protein n=1 Tax=Dyadobacter fanqingshengii TaxID=2906443 RepID=UPI001F36AF4A|nr:thermonuclease family protein [Dyadobacter fanqingshengii]MCF2506995.1 thermonuclease family protein [Dyadobacter fanqingshengii]
MSRVIVSKVKFNFLIALTVILALSSFNNDNASRLQNGSIQQHYDLPNPLKAEVIGIQDGDTIELKFLFAGKKAGQRMGKPIRIRLLHVNCPERGRPYYKVAKQYTSQQCFRKTVQIRHAGNFDRYGRLLGEVVLPNGRILNKELVKAGLAVHFKKYSKSQEYSNLEIQAKKQKLGIWSQSPTFFGQL